MIKPTQNKIFDYRTLRFFIGIIAFLLPFIVSIVSSTTLTSVSASYHTEARDWFVGLLFIVAGFLLAYNGHTKTQSRISKIAAFAAAGIALSPSSCDKCDASLSSILHSIFAAILFAALAYFCLGPFRQKLLGEEGKKARRRRTYFLCGVTIIICMVSLAVSNLVLPREVIKEFRIVYWGEAIALIAFGIAWFVSGKVVSFFADNDERLNMKILDSNHVE